MSLQIINNDGNLSLLQLQEKMAGGYSVVKSPHVGNQHPSNLVCAALDIPFNVVTFTKGCVDVNFHPHLRISRQGTQQIADAETWTPFNYTHVGECDSVENYHLQSLQKRFPRLAIRTDIALMQSELALAETVLRVMTNTIPRVWYRRVSATGGLRKYCGDPVCSWDKISQDVFGVSNQTSGWVVPNRGHILYELILQSVSSGRDTVYHLSGPQMVGYVGGLQKCLSVAYDAIRQELPWLPETLTVHIVPVASARMVTHASMSQAAELLEHTLGWYESSPPEARRCATERFGEVVSIFPEYTRSIESGTVLTHYDIDSVDDLLLSPWMLKTPLKRVEGLYRQLLRSHTQIYRV